MKGCIKITVLLLCAFILFFISFICIILLQQSKISELSKQLSLYEVDAVTREVVRYHYTDEYVDVNYEQGYEDGYSSGRYEGYEEGYNEGYWRGSDDCIEYIQDIAGTSEFYAWFDLTE